MNENLDLTKILEGYPEGMKFYSSLYGEVAFVRVRPNKDYPIELKYYPEGVNHFGVTAFLTRDGRAHISCVGECTLFPSKDQRDWSKFERFWDKPKNADKFDPNTFQPFDKVLVRDYPTETWTIELFSYKRNTENSIRGLSYWWKQCIPYNEETKHLLGTKEDCPEYYKWWEE